MKNFIIGIMLGVWLGPISKDVTRRLVEKLEEETRPA